MIYHRSEKATPSQSVEEQRRAVQERLKRLGIEVSQPAESMTDSLLDAINSGDYDTIVYTDKDTDDIVVRTIAQAPRLSAAAIYARAARDDARSSVTTQVTALRDWAEGAGWEVRGVWSDVGRPGEGWANLVAALRAGEIGLLLLWDPSRATRDRSEWANLIEACRAAQVKIGTCIDGCLYDPDDPDDRLKLDVLMS